MNATDGSTTYRFGDFELTLMPLALTRSGIAVRLRAQPLQLLALLAARPSELVTHEEIRRTLWNRRVVEFSRGEHVCVGQLRAALGDDAARPRYIETVPRQGYRFLLPVEHVAAPRRPAAPPRPPAPPARRPEARELHVRRSRVSAIAAASALGLVLVGSGALFAWRDQSMTASADSGRDAYLRGEHLLTVGGRDNLSRSIHYFAAAIAADPASAEAHVGLAEAYRGLGALADAKAHAVKAVALAPRSADAHAQMALSLMQSDFAWERARVHVERALTADPGSAIAHESSAALHAILGDLPAALAAMERALKLDPVKALLRADFGWLHYYHGDHEAAIARCGEALDLDPRHLASLLCIERAAEAKRDLALARDTALRIMKLWGAPQEDLAAVGALAPAEAARAYHEWRLAFFQHYPDQSVIHPEDLAEVNAALGNYETALAELERAAAARAPVLPFMLIDPVFAPLRSEARFTALRERLNLASATQG